MAYERGYRSYRGRTPRGRIVLTVLLVVVIAAAIAVMLLSRNIVYDETGTPHLELPWQEETAPAEKDVPEDSLEITVQEPEGLQPVRAFSLGETPLTQAVWGEAYSIPQMPQNAERKYNAMAVTVKGSAGTVYFDSATAVAGSVRLGEDTAEAISLMNGDSAGYDSTIARLSCFHDPKAANWDVEGMGLKNTGGYIFYDGNNSQWLDPAKPAAREYLCGLAKEAAELGFDEILLTDVSYPTVGKLDKINYGEGEKSANLTAFLKEMRAALEPYGVALSIEVPEAVISQGYDDDAGLLLAAIAPQVDRIYAVTTEENAPALAQAVSNAHETTQFVPELTDAGPTLDSFLIFS